MTLPLVGGEIHDWNWLLGHAGLLRWTGFLAGATHGAASLIVLGSLGALLWLAFFPERR
jgi:hypothetical protein